MTLFFAFFCLFSSLALLSAILVIASKNPVFSVLFLILTFCNVSSLLFLLNLEFLPITFLVVYVGAIAVLFLFVLMMLNIKITEIKPDNAHFVPVAVLLTTVFVVEISLLTRLEFLPITFQLNHGLFISDLSNSIVNFVNSSLFAINESNMRSIGQVLFVDYWPQFIVVGYVLLFAMVGSIILTLHKTFVSKSQNVYFQTLRNFDKCIVMYS